MVRGRRPHRDPADPEMMDPAEAEAAVAEEIMVTIEETALRTELLETKDEDHDGTIRMVGIPAVILHRRSLAGINRPTTLSHDWHTLRG